MASVSNCTSSIDVVGDRQFDFIIAGGGTAGLVLARRLTEDPNLHVLVVEAGADRREDPKILTPGMVGTMYSDPDYDWDYLTEPQVGGTLHSQERTCIIEHLIFAPSAPFSRAS